MKISKNETIILSAICALSLIAAACNRTPVGSACTAPYGIFARISGAKLCVQTVSSESDKAKGLGERDSMQENEGMLFDFRRGEEGGVMVAFWMKDMKFDLDLIWVKNNKIIGITKNVPAPKNTEQNQDDKLKSYSPPSAVDAVVEVNAGWSERNGVKAGDEVRIRN